MGTLSPYMGMTLAPSSPGNGPLQGLGCHRLWHRAQALRRLGLAETDGFIANPLRSHVVTKIKAFVHLSIHILPSSYRPIHLPTLFHPSIYPFTHPSTHSLVHLANQPRIYLSIYSFTHPSVYSSTHPCINLSLYSTIPPFILLPSYISTYIFIYPPIHSFISYVSIHSCFYNSIHLPICLSIHPHLSMHSPIPTYIYPFISQKHMGTYYVAGWGSRARNRHCCPLRRQGWEMGVNTVPGHRVAAGMLLVWQSMWPAQDRSPHGV